MISFSKGELVTINDRILESIYYWKFEETHQEAKNGMHRISMRLK